MDEKLVYNEFSLQAVTSVSIATDSQSGGEWLFKPVIPQGSKSPLYFHLHTALMLTMVQRFVLAV